MQHIRLGGGMCAQAVAFMATALLSQYSSSICGVSEISALAQMGDVSKGDTILLGGLSPRRISDYFERVSLGCSLQGLPGPLLFTVRSESPDWLPNHLFLKALHAYVLSELPVVVFTDARYMASIYHRMARRSGWNIRLVSGDRFCHHAILLVGCSKDAGAPKFLANDPASLPFLPVDGIELVDARPDITVPLPDGTLVAGRGPLVCGPVAPHEVRCPLLTSTYPPERIGWGIFLLSAWLWKRVANGLLTQSPFLQAFADGESIFFPGEVVLLRPDMQHVRRIAKRLAGVDDAFLNAIEQLRNSNGLSRWQWLQMRRLEVKGNSANTSHGQNQGKYHYAAILWNASADPPMSGSESARLIDAILLRSATGWECWVNPDRDVTRKVSPTEPRIGSAQIPRTSVPTVPSTRDSETEQSQPTTLRPSLISSYVGKRFCVAAHCVRKSVKALDVYALMQTEQYVSPGETAVTQMARDSRDKAAVGKIAGYIARSAKPDLSISGLASFAPTLSFPPADRQAQVARDALYFLYHLAIQLRQQHAANVYPIEIVCGSRVTGLFPAIDNDLLQRQKFFNPDTYAATILSDESAKHNLLANLKQVLIDLCTDGLAKQGDTDEHPVFALELEPGAVLFSVRDWRTLRDVSHAVAKDDILRGFVGLNLDIAHYNLAGISPQQVASEGLVLDLVVHGHCSGFHRCAHFGDIPPLIINEKNQFLPWISLLRTRFADKTSIPRYSGYVALELEATRNRGFLNLALYQLTELIREGSQ